MTPDLADATDDRRGVRGGRARSGPRPPRSTNRRGSTGSTSGRGTARPAGDLEDRAPAAEPAQQRAEADRPETVDRGEHDPRVTLVGRGRHERRPADGPRAARPGSRCRASGRSLAADAQRRVAVPRRLFEVPSSSTRSAPARSAIVRATRSSRSAARAESSAASASSTTRASAAPVEAADRAERPAGDPGVQPAAPRRLAVARRRDARGHGRTVLGALGPAEQRRRHARHRHPQVDPVAQRSGDPAGVAVGDAGLARAARRIGRRPSRTGTGSSRRRAGSGPGTSRPGRPGRSPPGRPRAAGGAPRGRPDRTRAARRGTGRRGRPASPRPA